MPPPRLRLTIPLIIIVATLGTFAPVLSCNFVQYDDTFHILSNPRFNPPTLANAGKYWTERGFFGLYIPLTYTAWTIVGQLAFHRGAAGVSFNPTVFHAANLLLHIASALIVFAILRRVIGRDWLAGVGALLFALHPLQVEAVAWISGFRDVFAGFLSLLTIWQYLRFAESTPSRRRSNHVLTLALFALALLAKPTAVVVPILVAVIDILIVRRAFRNVARAVAPMIAMSILAAAWARVVQPSILLPDRPSLLQRPLIACDAISFYLLKLIWPAHLGIDYGRTPSWVLDHGGANVTWLVPVSLLVVLLVLRRHISPIIWAAILIFVTSLLPVLGFVPFDFQQYSTVADRYVYLAMFGVALAAAAGLARLQPRVAAPLAVIVLTALAAGSFRQAQVWRDSPTLFAHALRENSLSWLAHTNLGLVTPNSRDAEALFRRAVELNPNYAEARLNLGASLADRGELDEAIEQFEVVVRLRPDISEARRNLDNARRLLAQRRAGHPTTRQ